MSEAIRPVGLIRVTRCRFSPAATCRQPPVTSYAFELECASGPEPGVADHEVDGGGAGAVGDVDAGVQPELARQLVAKAEAAAGDVLAHDFIVAPAGAGRTDTAEADDAPALVELPAQLGLRRRRLLTLIAHRRHAAQRDEGPQEERRARRRPGVIAARAEGHVRGQRQPADQGLLKALEIVARAERAARREVRGLGIDAAGRREQVVPGVVLEDRRRRRDLDPHRLGQAGKDRVVAQRRIDVGIDVAQPEPPRRLGRELPAGLRHHRAELQRVAHALVDRRQVEAGTVEVEVGAAEAGADQRLQPPGQPQAGITGEGAPGAVLGAEGADAGDVRACPSLRPGLVSRAQEHGRRAAAIADRGLGDDDRYRQEAVRGGEVLAQVELPVLGVDEARPGLGGRRGRHRISLLCGGRCAQRWAQIAAASSRNPDMFIAGCRSGSDDSRFATAAT